MHTDPVLTDRARRLRAGMAVELLRDMPLVQGLDDGELGTLHQLLRRSLATADAADAGGDHRSDRAAGPPTAGTTE